MICNNTLGLRGPCTITPECYEGVYAARISPRVLSVIMPDARKIKGCLFPTYPYLNSSMWERETRIKVASRCSYTCFGYAPWDKFSVFTFSSWHIITYNVPEGIIIRKRSVISWSLKMVTNYLSVEMQGFFCFTKRDSLFDFVSLLILSY